MIRTFSNVFGTARRTPQVEIPVEEAAGVFQGAVTRRLVTAYASNLVKVRRSSDSTEADIGMNADFELDSGALLTHTKTTAILSTGALYCPGTSSVSQGASIPDAANLDITDDLELWALVEPTTWAGNSGTAEMLVVGKWNTTGDQRSYYLSLAWDTSSLYTLSFRTTTGGTSGTSWAVYGTAAVSGWTGRKWIRISRRKSDGRIQFFHADPGVGVTTLPVSWTQLGSNRTGSTAAVHVGTALARVGCQGTNTTLNYAGKVERALILNGLLGVGSTIVDIDFTADADRSNLTSTFVCDTGQTVTLYRNGDSAYVTKLYDQSGNTNDAVQATAANQPRLVNAGAIEQNGGKVTMRFRPGSETHHLDAPCVIDGQASIAAVFSLESTGVASSRIVSLGDSTDNDVDGFYLGKGVSNGGASWVFASPPVSGLEVVAPLGDIQIATGVLDAAFLHTYADGTAVTPASAETDTINVTTLRIGNALQGSLQHGGTISEVQVFSGALE